MSAGTAQTPPTPPTGLSRSGLTYLVREQVRSWLFLGLMLVSAGTWQWWNAWLHLGVLVVCTTAYQVAVARTDAEVFNARGQTHAGTKPADRWFFALMTPAALAGPVVAGLEVGQAGWTGTPAGIAAGCILMAAGFAGTGWAMAVNRFFEPTVRIQSDRGHAVCTTGPYRWLRHPGYAFALIGLPGLPLITGSVWSALPAALFAAALIARTAFEDRVLHEELEGYREYAERTRFRLLPALW